MEKAELSKAIWRKSSRSNADTACVEVAFVAERVAFRDSKNPDGGTLVVTGTAWRQLVHGFTAAG